MTSSDIPNKTPGTRSLEDLRSRSHESVPGAHFDSLYLKRSDPWDYQTSAFEAVKRAHTIAALGGRSFVHGLELGCSIGVLTAELAPHCKRLVGVDGSAIACARARANLAAIPSLFAHVEIIHARFPKDLGKLRNLGEFDLVVLSEVLYFFSAEHMEALADYVSAILSPSGLCVVVNFEGETNAGFTGQEARELFTHLSKGSLEQLNNAVFPGFEIVTFVRRSPDEVQP